MKDTDFYIKDYLDIITIGCHRCREEHELGHSAEVTLSACNDWAEHHTCEEQEQP